MGQNTHGREPEDAAERDPLELAQKLADDFTKLEAEKSAPGGTRERNNTHLNGSYGLYSFYREHPDQYSEFKALPYLRGLHERENVENMARIVLTQTMQAKGNDNLLNRVYKTAPVFDSFYAEGIAPDNFLSNLKARGGVDNIYDTLTRAKKAQRTRFIGAEKSGAPEATTMAPHLDNPSIGKVANGNGGGNIALHAVRENDDDALRQSAVGLPGNDTNLDDVTPPGEINRYDKKGPLSRIDLDTEVAIRFAADDVDAILNSAAGNIDFSVVRRDGRGWVHIVGRIKQIVQCHEGAPIGDHPRSNGDNDDQLDASSPSGSVIDVVASEPTGRGAQVADTAGPTAHQIALPAATAPDDHAASTSSRENEDSANRRASPTTDRVLSAQASIVPASKAFSAAKGAAIKASGSGTMGRKHAGAIRANTPGAESPFQLEELPDLSAPQQKPSTNQKPRQRR